MSDPYSVLGVGVNATDEEIKTAYRNLAKKYHPDHYTDTPLAELAAEKMKEVNEAYDIIMKQRKAGNSGAYNSSYYGNYGGNTNFSDVRSLFMQGRLSDAEQILDGVPSNSRNAEWFFLKGSIQYRRGFLEQALFNVQTACNMDPQNEEYRVTLNRMNEARNGQFSGYNSTNNTMGGTNCNACDACTCLLCSDSCCECMGGDLIKCC